MKTQMKHEFDESPLQKCFFSTSFKIEKPEGTNVGAGSPWVVPLEEWRLCELYAKTRDNASSSQQWQWD